MGGVRIKYKVALQTVLTVHEAIELLKNSPDELYAVACRDSVIKRFEYSLDAFWKFLSSYLQDYLKYEFTKHSPREIFRVAYDLALIDEKSYGVLIDCINDRNLAVHTYQERLARALIARIPAYCSVMQDVLNKVEDNIGKV